MLLRLIITIVILILLAFFIADNQFRVTISFFQIYELKEIPASILVLASILFGVLLTLPIYLRQKFRFFKKVRTKKKEIRHQKREIDSLKKEIPTPKQLTYEKNH